MVSVFQYPVKCTNCGSTFFSLFIGKWEQPQTLETHRAWFYCLKCETDLLSVIRGSKIPVSPLSTDKELALSVEFRYRCGIADPDIPKGRIKNGLLSQRLSEIHEAFKTFRPESEDGHIHVFESLPRDKWENQ